MSITIDAILADSQTRVDVAWREGHSRLAMGDLDGALARVGRNSAPTLLFDAWFGERITNEDLARVLPGVWAGAEWPAGIIPARVWLEWFRAAGYPQPQGSLTLYRGYRPRYVRALSWTTDRERAELFAGRWSRMTSHPTHVYVAEAPPESILADIDALDRGGRGEREIIVDPSLLGPVRRVLLANR